MSAFSALRGISVLTPQARTQPTCVRRVITVLEGQHIIFNIHVQPELTILILKLLVRLTALCVQQVTTVHQARRRQLHVSLVLTWTSLELKAKAQVTTQTASRVQQEITVLLLGQLHAQQQPQVATLMKALQQRSPALLATIAHKLERVSLQCICLHVQLDTFVQQGRTPIPA